VHFPVPVQAVHPVSHAVHVVPDKKKAFTQLWHVVAEPLQDLQGEVQGVHELAPASANSVEAHVEHVLATASSL